LPLNLPNRITVARILMIPLCLLFMALDTPAATWLAAAVFAVASFTDYIDGYLASKRGEVTDFGKFMDPIADKLLVLLPMILLCSRRGPSDIWAPLLMVAREIIVSGFRLVAVTRGTVIAAGPSGKAKTVVQIIAVLALTLKLPFAGYITWLAAVLSVYSGAEILLRNRRILEERG
jgi:CDP-diacylglycerol--glycerol-3-phosphate 3-phosphatidyltransferase